MTYPDRCWLRAANPEFIPQIMGGLRPPIMTGDNSEIGGECLFLSKNPTKKQTLSTEIGWEQPKNTCSFCLLGQCLRRQLLTKRLRPLKGVPLRRQLLRKLRKTNKRKQKTKQKQFWLKQVFQLREVSEKAQSSLSEHLCLSAIQSHQYCVQKRLSEPCLRQKNKQCLTKKQNEKKRKAH